MRLISKFSVIAFTGLAILWGEASIAQVLDDSANMKILRVRSKLLEGDATNKYSAGQLSSYTNLEEEIRAQATCGAIDIGNQDVNSNFAGEINIIIAGDVINTGNNCQ